MVAATLAALLAGACGTATLRPEVRGGAFDISGDVGVSVGSGRAGAGSSASALGLDTEGYAEPKLDVDWEGEDWHVSARGFFVGYSGSGTAQAGISLGPGPGIGVNEPVRSDVDLTLLRTSVVHDMVGWRDDVDVGVGAGFGWFFYDLDVQSLAGPGSVGTDSDLPFGFLTMRFRMDHERFEFGAEASGILWDYEDEELSYYDVEAHAGYRLFDKNWTGMVSVGWRLLGFDYEYSAGGSRVFADATLHGPFVSFTAEF